MLRLKSSLGRLGRHRRIHCRDDRSDLQNAALCVSFADDRGAIVRGMALGGGSGLSQGAADAFRDAGLWHLLAVSGQNVGVVAVATMALSWCARTGTR